MTSNLYKHRTPILAGLIVIFVFVVALWPAPLGRGVRAQESTQIIPNIPVIPPGSAYRQTNFISDSPGVAFVLDPLMVNPWGISMTASSPFWVANNGTSTTQLIRGDLPSGSLREPTRRTESRYLSASVPPRYGFCRPSPS